MGNRLFARLNKNNNECAWCVGYGLSAFAIYVKLNTCECSISVHHPPIIEFIHLIPISIKWHNQYTCTLAHKTHKIRFHHPLRALPTWHTIHSWARNNHNEKRSVAQPILVTMQWGDLGCAVFCFLSLFRTIAKQYNYKLYYRGKKNPTIQIFSIDCFQIIHVLKSLWRNKVFFFDLQHFDLHSFISLGEKTAVNFLRLKIEHSAA